MTSTKKITDFVSFNPKRTIKKGETKPFVEMAALPVDSRDISEIGSRTYKGGGSRFQDGDTLFARITPCLENGKTAKTSGLGDGVIAHGSTEFIVLAAKEPEYDEDYVYYLARMPEFRSYAQSRMEGTSGRQRVSWQSLAEFELDFPDKEDRKEIGRILKSIDDKIQVNNQLNQTLEQIAQAIFKSWFVDFEPVKAKIAVLEAGGTAEQAELAAMSTISAKDEAALKQLQAEQPDAYAELAQTAALFPSAMEESALGEIPEGWDVSTIGEEVKISGGGTPSTKNQEYWQNGSIHWTTPKDLSNLTDKVLTDTERKITESGLGKISSGLLPVNTVLMSSRAPVGYLALAKIPVAINQGYIAMQCEKRLSPEFVLQWASSNMDEIKQRASGTTFAEISKKNFRPIPVIVPSENIVSAFSSKAKIIYDKIYALLEEVKTLSSIRDTTLPPLLSGDIEITELNS